MPPGDDDRPSDPAPFESFGEEVTVRDLQVNADDLTLDETHAAAARAREMTEEDQSRVVARPASPDPDDDLQALEAFTVEIECELTGWEEAEEEATVHLTDHQLTKLRAAAASDDAEVFGGAKPPDPAPQDPAALPLPPVLDPDLD